LRNFFTLETLRVTGAIPFLMVSQGNDFSIL